MTPRCTFVNRLGCCLLFALLGLCGCQTAHDVAVRSFRVLDAPRQYVRRQIRGETPDSTPAPVESDSVTTPGRTVDVAPSTQPRPSASPRFSPAAVAEKSKPAPSPSRNVTNQTQYPTAKPVPGKPGYVFSPFDQSGGYVDVTGYSPGQKVKDPYSGKIFLVP